MIENNKVILFIFALCLIVVIGFIVKFTLPNLFKEDPNIALYSSGYDSNKSEIEGVTMFFSNQSMVHAKTATWDDDSMILYDCIVQPGDGNNLNFAEVAIRAPFSEQEYLNEVGSHGFIVRELSNKQLEDIYSILGNN